METENCELFCPQETSAVSNIVMCLTSNTESKHRGNRYTQKYPEGTKGLQVHFIAGNKTQSNAVYKKTHLYFLSDEPWAYTAYEKCPLYHSAALHTIFI